MRGPSYRLEELEECVLLALSAYGVTKAELARSIGWSRYRLDKELIKLDEFMADYLVYCIKIEAYRKRSA